MLQTTATCHWFQTIRKLMRHMPGSMWTVSTVQIISPCRILLRSMIAFYDNCWETNLGIMDRTDLEPLLRAHFENRIPRKEPAWFALRNVIFAAGYRSLLATNPNMPFAVMQAKAGYYFNNALSMFTRLILPPSSLMAIRALMLMVCVYDKSYRMC